MCAFFLPFVCLISCLFRMLMLHFCVVLFFLFNRCVFVSHVSALCLSFLNCLFLPSIACVWHLVASFCRCLSVPRCFLSCLFVYYIFLPAWSLNPLRISKNRIPKWRGTGKFLGGDRAVWDSAVYLLSTFGNLRSRQYIPGIWLGSSHSNARMSS